MSGGQRQRLRMGARAGRFEVESLRDFISERPDSDVAATPCRHRGARTKKPLLIWATEYCVRTVQKSKFFASSCSQKEALTLSYNLACYGYTFSPICCRARLPGCGIVSPV